MANYIIIGNGPAGTKAGLTIREREKDSNITIISGEDFPFYYRPQLVESLLRRRSIERLLVEQKEFYKENRIELLLNSRVSAIRPDSRKVILENGQEFSYDRLLLATGLYPYFRSDSQEGIESIVLKTAEDLEQIKAQIKGANAAVLEGDYPFNLELARLLIEKEVDVFLLIKHKRLWPEMLDKKASKIVAKILKEKGVEVFYNTNIKEIKKGKGRTKDIITSEGEVIRCEIVGGGDCINPNEALFKEAGLQTKKGLAVDSKLQTNIEGIFSAGDVAEIKGLEAFFGWQRALKQGEVAGRGMLGEGIEYNEVPGINLQIFGNDFVLIGDINPESREGYEELILETSDKIYKKLVFKDNKAVGSIFIGDIKGKELATDLIREAKELNAAERSLLKRQLEEKEEETTSLDLLCPVCKVSINLKLDTEVGTRVICDVCGVELELKKTEVSLVKRLVVA